MQAHKRVLMKTLCYLVVKVDIVIIDQIIVLVFLFEFTAKDVTFQLISCLSYIYIIRIISISIRNIVAKYNLKKKNMKFNNYNKILLLEVKINKQSKQNFFL